jgi:2,3-bisphosphoglycerate-independent phosphoglycerate mutase
LEAAFTPNLDFLAKNGICGLIKPYLYNTLIPTSEDTHFAQFGYDLKIYQIRRGLPTVLGCKMKIKKGEVALRGNLANVDENLNINIRRVVGVKNVQLLIKDLNGIKIDNIKFLVKDAIDSRLGIIMRGKGLSYQISDSDPFYTKLEKKVAKVLPLKKDKKAIKTAKILNQFLEKAHNILKNHPLNKKREKEGLIPANYVITRGASFLKKVPSFEKKYKLKAAFVAGGVLYKGIAKILGMKEIKIKGATGLFNTNLKGKILAVKKNLKKYDFIFCHIKATDTFSHLGDFQAKKEFIEKIDKNLKPILNLKNTLIVVTADHSTCSLLKRHCNEPIPILIYGKEKDKVEKFSEKACQRGKLEVIDQLNLMPKILKIANRFYSTCDVD